LALIIGFIFTQKASNELGIKLKWSHFLLYFFSTALFYFSFFTITTIEIYLFALSAFSLNGILKIFNSKKEGVDAFSIGTAMGLLISAKLTFLCFFFAGIWIVFNSSYRKDNKFIFFFFLGTSLSFMIAIMKDIASCGEIVMISRNLSSHITLFNWLDLYWTIRQGVFGEGGLFYTNPLYAVSLFGMLIMSFEEFKKNKRSLILWILFFLWMLMSYFQTATIVGPVLDDHYVGRPMLAALPLMLISLAFLMKNFERYFPFRIKVVVSIILLIWQGYTLSNYLAISSLNHYAYAISKTVPFYSDLIDHISLMIKWKNTIIGVDLFKFSAFILISTWILYSIYANQEKLEYLLRYYFRVTVVILLLMCLFNLENSRRNGIGYIEKNHLKGKVAVVDRYELYSFVYITDAFRTELYNSRDPELSKLIRNMHSAYLEKINPLLKEGSTELRRAIEKKDLNYSFYSK
jgi:hypothetical protein